MAHVKGKVVHKKKKNRANKIHLVFDAEKRREFLTGFHKRKLQRKKKAQEDLEKELKEERKRLKSEAKESYKKLVVSHRPIPELEHLLADEYEDEDVTVKVVELSTADIAKSNNWIGPNQPKTQSDEEDEQQQESAEDEEEEEEAPGMELKKKKPKKEVEEPAEKPKFKTERDVKKVLKKQATRNVKKSKVFQMKNKIESQKQRKKSMKLKKERMKLQERQNKGKKGRGSRKR